MLTLVLISWVAGASPGTDPDLTAAEQAYEQARYREVLPALARALEKGLPVGDQLRAHELAAMTYAAFDDGASAVAAFGRALQLDPRFLPGPAVSPKVHALFEEARRRSLPATLVTPPGPGAGVTPGPALEPSPPLWKRPWFWVVAGVVAAGAAGGVVYAAGQRVPGGSLGRGELQ